MAQFVATLLLPNKLFSSRQVYVVFVVDKVALGQVFSEYVVCPQSLSFQQSCILLSLSLGHFFLCTSVLPRQRHATVSSTNSSNTDAIYSPKQTVSLNCIFCWLCILLWFLVKDQLNAQFFSMYLFQFSTFFEQTRRPAYETVIETEWHIPDVVLIQLILLIMGTRLLETCRELE